MQLDTEISHLLDLMPASGRMFTKIVSRPEQSRVIDIVFPKPWNRQTRPIYIHFDLWKKLSRAERDLLLLRAVNRLINIRWFKPNLEQGLIAGGLLGTIVEAGQQDPIGIILSAGLVGIAAQRLWRKQYSTAQELEADESAIAVALRRGYSESKAARALLDGLEACSELEGRSLNFVELLRCQNLKNLANLSVVGVPASIRDERSF
jgi:hypothetical protein